MALIRHVQSWFLLALVVACADLQPPPPAGQAGAGSMPSAGNGSQTAGAGATAANSSGTAGGGGARASTGGAQSGAGGSLPVAGLVGAGAGGSAGEGAGSDCGSVTSGDIRAWVHPELPAATSNELHPFFALTNTGADVALKRLAIRYYFSAEMSGAWETACIWVTKRGTGEGALCENGAELKIVELEPPHPQADHYLEVSFADIEGESLSSSQSTVFEARTMFWRSGHPMLNQANDYSFAPTTNEVLTIESREYKQTTRVTVYRDGLLVWGEEPCP